MDLMTKAAIIGIGATAVMDLWAAFQRAVFAVPSLNYAMVGRWLGHCARGRVFHPSIAKATPIAGERVLGWTAHYAIGIAFAALLLAVWGPGWADRPTPLPALAVGIGTIVLPFFVMQPGMGAGIAAARTPDPRTARLRSLVAHASFGVGLYLAALALAALTGPPGGAVR